jgi:hypothetical protein
MKYDKSRPDLIQWQEIVGTFDHPDDIGVLINRLFQLRAC